MGWLSQNMTLIFQFLPGFITAAIVYSLTAHPKSNEFERVIQALIFTVFLKISLLPIRSMLIFLGTRHFALGKWSPDIELAWMTLLAVPLGLGYAWIANRDWFHNLARAYGLTKRTSYPSEWNGAFARCGSGRYIVLHLKEGRRLRGWPEEWPDQPEKGHFVINDPEWLLDDATIIPLYQTRHFLIAVNEVERVEILWSVEELPANVDDLKQAQEPLIRLHRSKESGSKTIESIPESAEHSINTNGPV